MCDDMEIPVLANIRHAWSRIRPQVRMTPILNDPDLDAVLGCELYCKCENLQRTGSFKFRGASNAILRLREDGVEGDVATHSSGNHGAALALAAWLDGRTAHVVMPENASLLKIAAVRQYGGIVHFCPPTHAGRESGLAGLVAAGHIPIPPYDHFDIISGQGTSALEVMQTNADIDALITPVGGGGLVSGTAIVGAGFGVPVYAAEPAGAADTAASFARAARVDSWQPDTIADGLRALVGVRNFAIIQQQVNEVVTVEESEIRDAMRLAWRHLRLLIEPSSAVAIAAVRKSPELFSGKKVGAIITGANIDPADWLALAGTGT